MTIIYLAGMAISCIPFVGDVTDNIVSCAVLPPGSGMMAPATGTSLPDGTPSYCVTNDSTREWGSIQIRKKDGGVFEILMSPGVRPCATPVG